MEAWEERLRAALGPPTGIPGMYPGPRWDDIRACLAALGAERTRVTELEAALAEALIVMEKARPLVSGYGTVAGLRPSERNLKWYDVPLGNAPGRLAAEVLRCADRWAGHPHLTTSDGEEECEALDDAVRAWRAEREGS